ncbi:hypothetical protein PTSG_04473 [Salpingoeca rosetta]|uniref:Uncharacterized protein n=1 Tax=Salpingoeca rosetta (strain ATCC 50818 / BSB-021) TaxID=946362 RepID=F2U8N6_SALR5|nr:uncharacterized protein PTSG_04473 [Salpingoeca rosetta]EGD72744.1 hypothetical protein PTSG_04473 [Salpingoeca rosetta]|eukprot:XP_004994567.1 hypothetical protein PTSG_04473 [Salpingoeca rosetta]
MDPETKDQVTHDLSAAVANLGTRVDTMESKLDRIETAVEDIKTILRSAIKASSESESY